MSTLFNKRYWIQAMMNVSQRTTMKQQTFQLAKRTQGSQSQGHVRLYDPSNKERRALAAT